MPITAEDLLTRDVVRPRGAGSYFMPAAFLRKVLIEGLVDLAGDAYRTAQLFERLDVLAQGSAEDWRADLQAVLAELVTSQRARARVTLGWPEGEARLPVIGIVPDGGGEGSSPYLGDLLESQYLARETFSDTDIDGNVEDFRKYIRIDTHGVPQTDSVEITVWATVPDQAIALHAAIGEILARDKARLQAAGVENLSISRPASFQPDAERFPGVGFVPRHRVTIEWMQTWERRTSPEPGEKTATPRRVVQLISTFGN